jgi:hypothetical protein
MPSRWSLSLLALCTLGLVSAVAPAQAQRPQGNAPAGARPSENREVRVANETDRTLQQLFVFRVGTAEQGEDRLGTSVLPPRASLRVPLGRTTNCNWEVRAVFEDGEELRRRVDVCTAPRAVLTDTGPRREVELVNDGELPLRELYLSPPSARDPGRDRLGNATLGPGETLKLRLRGEAARECMLDMRAVFADDSEERRQGIDLCRSARIGFGEPDLPTREVPVVNRGRRTLREVYAAVALAGEDRGEGRAWGPDRLGSNVLAPRDTFRMRVRSRGCAFDLRGVFEDGRAEVQRNVDLCVVQGVVFGDQPVADAGLRRITLVNRHRRTIQQAYISPKESQDWGEDLLGTGVLRVDDSVEIETESGCRADLRIVFDSTAAEERRDIDICAVRSITLRPGWTVEDTLEDAAGAGTPPAAALPGPPRAGRLRLRNAAPLPVIELYADPPGAATRGPDRLGTAVLAAGHSFDLTPPEESAAATAAERCRADITAVFRDGREVTLPGRDLCASEELVLQ